MAGEKDGCCKMFRKLIASVMKKELTAANEFAGVELCPMLTSFGAVGDKPVATSPWGVIGVESG